MITKHLDAQDKSSFNQQLRRKRFAFFLDLFESIKTGRTISILDIGGEENYWQNMRFFDTHQARITLLNLKKVETRHPNLESVAGDATRLAEYPDNSFDIVFSNSCIEHLFTLENQRKMANEVTRVGRNYYVQTPNLYFPIEPHFIFPFFQFFPHTLRVFMASHMPLGNFPKLNKEAAESVSKEIRLLSENEMKQLFPDGKVYREYFGGLKKSVALYNFDNR